MGQRNCPMLATDADLEKLVFPLLASAKLDGVRAIVQGGVVLSRSLKPIPNKWVQTQLGNFENLDGELIVGEPTSKSCYRDTVSHVMSHDKEDFDLRFHVFDYVRNPSDPYHKRHGGIYFDAIRKNLVTLHPQHVVTCLCTLLELEEKMLDKGYEGLILRGPNAPYKFGRSTVKEGYLLKLKRFVDAEAVVIGHASGKTGRGDLGALIVRFGDVEFNIGTGFDDVERANVWNNRDQYLGRISKFKYFPVGVKEAPRHPVFLGWRESIDM